MVSINSNGNAIANWNSRNSTGTTTTTTPAPATEPTGTASSPVEVTGSGGSGATAASSPSPIITASPEAALVYSLPARTDIGQVSAPSRSLDTLLSDAGFFSRSAAAEASGTAAVEQVSASAMPTGLSPAEVIARAAYAIVADANADSAASSLIKQFG